VAAANGASNVQVSATNRFADLSPAWSPDGLRLAYVSNDGGHFNVYLVNPDGTDLTPLTVDNTVANPTVEFDQPSWQP
jgi:Tol biopolymer transport system component